MQRVRDLTDRPVGANIALLFNRDPAVVDLLAANDIRFVTTSAGDPSLFTDRLHDAGITVFHVVGTLAAAKKAVDAGVDGLVVEGVEGGGFKNRFGASTMMLLPLVAAHVEVPIVAAGGICDARSMAAQCSAASKSTYGWSTVTGGAWTPNRYGAGACWPRPFSLRHRQTSSGRASAVVHL